MHCCGRDSFSRTGESVYLQNFYLGHVSESIVRETFNLIVLQLSVKKKHISQSMYMYYLT